jgi:hypothetical protein
MFHRSLSPVDVKFKVEYTNILKKRQQYTIFELLSLIGGFLGLFAGLSVLSTVELLYFFVVYPIAVYRQVRSTKVYPFDDTSSQFEIKFIKVSKILNLLKNIWKFLKKYSENTTIHGFSHIVDSKKSIINRYVATNQNIVPKFNNKSLGCSGSHP